ncbi:MAG: exostosin family protein [Pirellulaceae bacterium]|nr:exostosin family protein [Pirellulaceae bacterium]
MRLITHDAHLIAQAAVPTEARAWELLRAEPLPGPINALAVPWGYVLEAAERRWEEHYGRLRRLRLNGGFTICQHVDYPQILRLCQRIGLDVVFTPHAVPAHADLAYAWRHRWRRMVRGQLVQPRTFRVLPLPHLAVNGVPPAPKDLWYSFIGTDTHACRRPLFQLAPRTDTVIAQRARWHFDHDPARQRAEREQFQQVLARSRFALCPRGTGPSTLRFWEALQAGAVPVLISDAMRLPAGYDWRRCILRLPEARAADVERLLRTVSPGREQQMRQCCLEAYRCFSGANLVRCIRLAYQRPRAEAA